MSRHINELAEIVLGHVYQLGYQHRSDIGKHHETADELVAVQRKLRETEQELERLRRAHMETQHEELTEARATIADLRQQLDVALLSLTGERLNADKRDREIETLRKQLDAAQREASDEFAERQVLQHEASDDYVELARLRAFVKLARGITPRNSYAGVEMLRAALAELDAGTSEPTPVTEPLNAEGGE
jgi:predicted RNase H-like nuclease (RuvC/YqgF family)